MKKRGRRRNISALLEGRNFLFKTSQFLIIFTYFHITGFHAIGKGQQDHLKPGGDAGYFLLHFVIVQDKHFNIGSCRNGSSPGSAIQKGYLAENFRRGDLIDHYLFAAAFDRDFENAIRENIKIPVYCTFVDNDLSGLEFPAFFKK